MKKKHTLKCKYNFEKSKNKFKNMLDKTIYIE